MSTNHLPKSRPALVFYKTLSIHFSSVHSSVPQIAYLAATTLVLEEIHYVSIGREGLVRRFGRQMNFRLQEGEQRVRRKKVMIPPNLFGYSCWSYTRRTCSSICFDFWRQPIIQLESVWCILERLLGGLQGRIPPVVDGMG